MPSDDSMVCSRGARPIPPGAGLDHCDDYAGVDAVIPPWPCRCFPGSFISDACLSAGSPPCSAIRCLRLLSHRPSQIPLSLSPQFYYPLFIPFLVLSFIGLPSLVLALHSFLFCGVSSQPAQPPRLQPKKKSQPATPSHPLSLHTRLNPQFLSASFRLT